MKSTLPSLLTTLAAAFSFAGTDAHADPIRWAYGSGAYTTTYETLGLTYPFGTLLASTANGARVGIFMSSVGLHGPKAGSTDVIASRLSTFYGIPGNATFRFDPPKSGYSLRIILEDIRWLDTGSLAFTGFFTGTISPSKVDIANTFTGPTTQSLLLGPDLYTVTISNPVFGSINAHVEVRQVRPTPEPSTLVLVGLGLSSLGLGTGRKWFTKRLLSP